MSVKVINQVSNPTISLIVPAYMEEKILDSILKTYKRELLAKYNAELIVSDGGSTDQTVAIAEQYADIIAVHTEKRRQTIAEGRNAGAELATGKALVFINGDTYPENAAEFLDFIAKWADGKSKYSNYGALATRVYVSADDKTMGDVVFYNLFNTYVNILNKIGLGMCRGECQIVRNEVFRSVSGYNPALAAGEDFDLFTRIAKIAKTRYVSDITVIESPRRFRQQGYFRVLFQWARNGFAVLLKGKASDSEWTAIR